MLPTWSEVAKRWIVSTTPIDPSKCYVNQCPIEILVKIFNMHLHNCLIRLWQRRERNSHKELYVLKRLSVVCQFWKRAVQSLLKYGGAPHIRGTFNYEKCFVRIMAKESNSIVKLNRKNKHGEEIQKEYYRIKWHGWEHANSRNKINVFRYPARGKTMSRQIHCIIRGQCIVHYKFCKISKKEAFENFSKLPKTKKKKPKALAHVMFKFRPKIWMNEKFKNSDAAGEGEGEPEYPEIVWWKKNYKNHKTGDDIPDYHLHICKNLARQLIYSFVSNPKNMMDINLMMAQTNCTHAQAVTALAKYHWDLVDAIMAFQTIPKKNGLK